MKFVNGTNSAARRFADDSEHPYGKREPRVQPNLTIVNDPKEFNMYKHILDLKLKPEPKSVLESKMLRASRTLPVSEIKKETEDILAVLRNLYKK